MDSPDKVKSPSTTGFKYNWGSKVEKDDDWHLVASQSGQVSFHLSSLSERIVELSATDLARGFTNSSGFLLTSAATSRDTEEHTKLTP